MHGICPGCVDYEIVSFTQSKYDGTPHFEVVGEWQRSGKLSMSYHLYPFEHQGFNQRTFLVAALHVSSTSLSIYIIGL